MNKGTNINTHSKLVFASAGRSMIEMLGVLAIIGVLSIGGLAGYKIAISKKKAGDLFNEIQIKTLSLIEKDLTKYAPGEEITFPDFKNAAFDVKMYRLDPTTNSDAEYEIEISNISSSVCKEILKNKINTPFIIQVGEKEFDPSNPDYSVCDQFDEQNTFNFISKAYAADDVTIRIPMPDPSSPPETARTEEDCQKKGGQWMASSKQCCMGEISNNDVYGERCCKNGQKKVFLANDNTQSTCCSSEKAAAYTIGDKEGIGCCAGEVYQISSGNWGCCDDPKGMYSDEKDPGNVGAVTSISFSELCSSGEQKWCCAPGWSAYCSERAVPQCCDGEVLKIAGKAQCCEKGNVKMQIFDSSEEWCCKNGEKAFLTDVGARCCAGEPYKAKYQLDYNNYSGNYGCCKKEDGHVLVNVFGADDFQACCLPGQYGYYDKVNNGTLCCDTEPTFDEKIGGYICGCLENEIEQTVYGGNPQARYCCPEGKVAYARTVLETPSGMLDPDTGKYIWDFSAVRTENACCPKDLLVSGSTSETGLQRYYCCDALAGETPVAVEGAPEEMYICCSSNAYGDEPTAYWNCETENALCCRGKPYFDGVSSYECCNSDTHVFDKQVEGSSSGEGYCCPKETPNAFWSGEQYKCCADGEKAYNLENTIECRKCDVDAVTCTSGDDTWCCEEGETCGAEKGECTTCPNPDACEGCDENGECPSGYEKTQNYLDDIGACGYVCCETKADDCEDIVCIADYEVAGAVNGTCCSGYTIEYWTNLDPEENSTIQTWKYALHVNGGIPYCAEDYDLTADDTFYYYDGVNKHCQASKSSGKVECCLCSERGDPNDGGYYCDGECYKYAG